MDESWIFVDIGFSSNNPTCGLSFGNEPSRCVQFSSAKQQIVERIRFLPEGANLLIEAPLSVCFDSKGNPKGRKIEGRAVSIGIGMKT